MNKEIIYQDETISITLEKLGDILMKCQNHLIVFDWKRKSIDSVESIGENGPSIQLNIRQHE